MIDLSTIPEGTRLLTRCGEIVTLIKCSRSKRSGSESAATVIRDNGAVCGYYRNGKVWAHIESRFDIVGVV